MNMVILADMMHVQAHLLTQVIKQIVKFPIKILAAADDEQKVYAKEKE
jgi:hypothetical protein